MNSAILGSKFSSTRERGGSCEQLVAVYVYRTRAAQGNVLKL